MKKLLFVLLLASPSLYAATITVECVPQAVYPDNTPYVAKLYNVQVDGVQAFSSDKSSYVADFNAYAGKKIKATCSTTNSGGVESVVSNAVDLDLRKPPSAGFKIRVKMSATSEIVLE